MNGKCMLLMTATSDAWVQQESQTTHQRTCLDQLHDQLCLSCVFGFIKAHSQNAYNASKRK